jgi:hypothetical protein
MKKKAAIQHNIQCNSSSKSVSSNSRRFSGKKIPFHSQIIFTLMIFNGFNIVSEICAREPTLKTYQNEIKKNYGS